MYALLFCFFFVGSLSQWPLRDDGIVNPSTHYQRFRKTEYDDPFFQWWYFWIKDTKTDTHYALMYSYSSSNFNTSGAYVAFCLVNGSTFRGLKTSKYPHEDLAVLKQFDFRLPQHKPTFLVTSIDDNTLHLQGKLTEDHTWVATGFDKQTVIEWDITYHRIYGWFGQPDFEIFDEFDPVIMWNTYTHNSQVEGTITINGEKFILDKSERFRGYGDMNWGGQFPAPPTGDESDLAYAWGWYSACQTNPNPYEDICIIAGTGLTYTGAPFYNMLGQFADIRIGNSTHIGVRWIDVWEGSILQTTLASTNDGKVTAFNVSRSHWVDFTDTFGTAKLPLTQTVHLKTTNYEVMMEFKSKPYEYNRILFPFKESVFSDFEALGATAKVSIWKEGTLIHTWTNKNGGLEFGYQVPINI